MSYGSGLSRNLDLTENKSCSEQYRIYQVREGRGGRPLAFLLCDTMGLEATPNSGVDTGDIVGILKGYIPDKYQFNPTQPFHAEAFKTLDVKDRIHCVVCVMDSTSPGLLQPETKKKVDEIRKKTKYENIPVMALLTKVDKVCPHVEKDLKNVYYSCHIRDLIKKGSAYLGIAESNVLPVKNYSSEIELNDTCDILLLRAMKQMLNFADNYIDNFD